jgi:3-hydroxyisobutyrate dehydrogenase-like beta-hydroxyacid dehydrogenase
MTIARIGVVGRGPMGSAMAQRLVAAGYHVAVSDWTQDGLDTPTPHGACRATLPADAAQDADLVLVSVRGERAVDEVLFDHGSIGETLRTGGYVLDTSATSPGFSQVATAKLAAYGLTRVEARAIGDPVRARLGRLRMLVGGSAEDLAAIAEVITTLASSVVHTGPIGTASSTMAIHRSLLADGFPATAQALLQELASRPLRLAGTPPTSAVQIMEYDVVADREAASA